MCLGVNQCRRQYISPGAEARPRSPHHPYIKTYTPHFCLHPQGSQLPACMPRARRLQRAAGTHLSDDRAWKIEGSRDWRSLPFRYRYLPAGQLSDAITSCACLRGMCPCPKPLNTSTFLHHLYGIPNQPRSLLVSPMTDANINAAPLPEPSHAITPAPPCLTDTDAIHSHFRSPCLLAKRGDFPPLP